MNFDNTNRGVLFPNDKKGNEKRPDFTGDLNVGGVEYRLSAWKKASKQGNNFLSISVQLKEGQKIPPKNEMPAGTLTEDNWAMFAEAGGVKGKVDWVPIDQVVNAINQLRVYRGDKTQQIYEVLGISDIIPIFIGKHFFNYIE